MPIEIIQSNGYVVEVRSVCDCCGKLIWTRLMLKKDAEAKMKTKIACSECKQKQNKEK